MLFHVHLQHKQLLKLSFINLGADDTKTACIFRLTFTDLVFFRNHIEVYPCTVLAWQHTLCTKDNTVFIVVSGKRLQNCLHFFLCILTRCLFAPACEDFICVMVDGEEMQLTLEQLIAAAEQGLSRANQSARADGMAGSQPGMTADGQNGDVYGRFLQAYPDVCPTDIPESVWEQANRTGDLLEAYRVFEIAQLRQELADLKLNQKNRERDVGSARSDGESRITDPIILALLGKG